MVAEGIVKGKGILYSVYALAIHTALDTMSVILVFAGWSALLIEGAVALFTVGMIIYIITSKKRFESQGKVYPVEKEQEMLQSDY